MAACQCGDGSLLFGMNRTDDPRPPYGELRWFVPILSEEPGSTSGLLKEELRLFGSLVMLCADENRIAAGGALTVDRSAFPKR